MRESRRLGVFLLLACGASTTEPTTTPEAEPITPTVEAEPAPRYSALEVGFDGACVLDGTTPVCWGEFFELFDDAEPRRIEELDGAREMAISTGMTACALMRDGALHCFGGYNENERAEANTREVEVLEEQLADETLTDAQVDELDRRMLAIEERIYPTEVATDVRDVVVFDGGGCYLQDAVHCWDEESSDGDEPNELVIGADAEIVQLASSSTHRCLLQADGRVRCWGYGDGLGWIPNQDDEQTPDQPGLTPARNAVEIAVGEEFTCYRSEGGSVTCWGSIQDYTEVPLGPDGSYIPFQVEGVANATHIVAGDEHACAIVAEGRVMCWGHNGVGALGTGTTDAAPGAVMVSALSPARELAAGHDATCALVGEEIRCVGSNRYAVFGAKAEQDPQLFPVRSTRVLAAGFRTCVETHGEVLCTGGVSAGSFARNLALVPLDDEQGNVDQLEGYISYQCVRRGTDVECGRLRGPARMLSDVSDVSVGTTSSCVLQNDRRVRCWRNRNDRRNHTDLLTRHGDPTLIPGVERAEALDVGDTHACVVRSDGRVVCWGDNTRGLVRAPAGELNTPVVLEGVRDAVQVSLNRSSTCVRKRDQTLTCRTASDWQDIELTGVVDVQARGYERYVLTADHRVYVLRSTRVTPLDLPAEIVEISTGTSHACGRARDGRTWCWGVGETGELGVLPSWVHLEPVVLSIDR